MELLHGDGRVQSNDPAVDARVNALLDECRALAARERFLHWELAFPGRWKQDRPGGFDAIIGNPPWDRIKLQEVAWFAERRPERSEGQPSEPPSLMTTPDAVFLLQ